jgi:hypothetical protein
MNGLAATQQPAMDGSGQGMGQGQEMVMQVVEALMSGATPEQLLQQGVPPEVIQMAMEVVASQTPAPQAGPEQAGLAGMQTQGVI